MNNRLEDTVFLVNSFFLRLPVNIFEISMTIFFYDCYDGHKCLPIIISLSTFFIENIQKLILTKLKTTISGVFSHPVFSSVV